MEKQEELWKPVFGYEGIYEVSNCGRVKSLPRKWAKGGILKPSPDGDGYLQVTLCKNGEESMGRVHQLVMRAFNGKIPDGKEIDHIDGNPSNNCLENLRCVPHKENMNNPVTVQRHAEAMQKLFQDPEWRKNVAEANRRLAQDPEWQKKNAEGRRKRSQNQEWRKNQAEAMKKLAQDPEWRKKQAEATRKALCKPVKQYTFDGTFIKRWSSVADAARELELSKGNISKCCKGKYKSTGGFIWKFAV